MGNFGWQELLIIFVILLLLFGATRLPALPSRWARASAASRRAFRGTTSRVRDEKPVASIKDKSDS